MKTQCLAGPWRFRQVGTGGWLPASVPGGVHTDLLAAGRIPDPFAGENELRVQWVAEQDWEYECDFMVEPGLLAAARCELICAGLDTLAELSLNGRSLGRTDNLFRSHRWEVMPLLRAGANTLTIVFRSPLPFIRSRQAQRRLPGAFSPGIAYLRKVQSHFGWDWGPALPTIGIWREVRLEAGSSARLDDVRVHQTHRNGDVTVEVQAEVEVFEPAAGPLEFAVTVIAPDGASIAKTVEVSETARVSIPIPNPQLWWPNGLGAQPLYEVEVAVKAGAKDEGVASTLASASYKIGLRTIALRREPDEGGCTFAFVVNGVPIFAKGANWIPADSFATRIEDARLAGLIRSAAAANMNMLRVWGGGYYESDRFYELCDRYGLLVWQDFAYACAAYPLDDPTFVENVRAEARQTIRRLRHHPCLALWCGNNEVEMMWWKFGADACLTDACEHFFHHELADWVRAEDPDHAYWPSSPSSGAFGLDTNGAAAGDTHDWLIWHGFAPPQAYRRHRPRFVSEFGLASLPAAETVAAFAGPGEHDLASRVMRHHQRSAAGNEKLIYYLTGRFRLPRAFADLITLTQIVQAEAIRTGVEHWRRNRPRCSGALYWQLNDCWPVVSWSSLDYYGRWKALHYAARRFYAPVALSLQERRGRVSVHVANDTRSAWQGRVRWSLETLTGEAVTSGIADVTVAPQTAAGVEAQDCTPQLRKHGKANLVFVAELWPEEAGAPSQPGRIARQVLPFLPEARIAWPDPALMVEVAAAEDGVTITVAAQALARFVVLSLPGADVIFSDNFFDLPAHRTAQIAAPLPPGWTVEQFRRSLRVRSLADIAPAGSPWSDRRHRAQALLACSGLIITSTAQLAVAAIRRLSNGRRRATALPR